MLCINISSLLEQHAYMSCNSWLDVHINLETQLCYVQQRNERMHARYQQVQHNINHINLFICRDFLFVL